MKLSKKELFGIAGICVFVVLLGYVAFRSHQIDVGKSTVYQELPARVVIEWEKAGEEGKHKIIFSVKEKTDTTNVVYDGRRYKGKLRIHSTNKDSSRYNMTGTNEKENSWDIIIQKNTEALGDDITGVWALRCYSFDHNAVWGIWLDLRSDGTASAVFTDIADVLLMNDEDRAQGPKGTWSQEISDDGKMVTVHADLEDTQLTASFELR